VTRILLADDHPMIRTAIEVLLRDTAYEIAGTAATGDEALSEVARVEPDILLLDLQMPGRNGMEVIRALDGKGKRPRVVVLTAAVDDSSLMEARALRIEGMVLKNSDPAFLLECLDTVERGGSWMDPELESRARELADIYGATARPALAPCHRM